MRLINPSLRPNGWSIKPKLHVAGDFLIIAQFGAQEGVELVINARTRSELEATAAEIVKKFGEQSLAGITFPNPSNQCWPMPMPPVKSCA